MDSFQSERYCAMVRLNGGMKFRKNSPLQNELCRLALQKRNSRDSHDLDGRGAADPGTEDDPVAGSSAEEAALPLPDKTLSKQELAQISGDVKQARRQSNGKRTIMMSEGDQIQQDRAAAAAAAAKKPVIKREPSNKSKKETDTLSLFNIHH